MWIDCISFSSYFTELKNNLRKLKKKISYQNINTKELKQEIKWLNIGCKNMIKN